MNKLILTLAIVAALALPGAINAADEPFAINLPAEYAAFSKQVQTLKSAHGNIEATNWVSKAPTGEAIVVTVSKMPGKILNPQKLIDSTRDSLLKSLSATLESQENLPSARLLFQGNGAFFRSRFVVGDDRLYQLLYVGRSAEQRSAEAVARIFESFSLSGPRP
jgi:hypothetical protein